MAGLSSVICRHGPDLADYGTKFAESGPNWREKLNAVLLSSKFKSVKLAVLRVINIGLKATQTGMNL